MPREEWAGELKTKEVEPSQFYKNKVINKKYMVKVELSLLI